MTGAHLDEPDLLRAGAISFSLTVVNILCIIAVALLMFKVKEVAPIKGKNLLFQKELRQRMEHQYRATMADPRLAAIIKQVTAVLCVGCVGSPASSPDERVVCVARSCNATRSLQRQKSALPAAQCYPTRRTCEVLKAMVLQRGCTHLQRCDPHHLAPCVAPTGSVFELFGLDTEKQPLQRTASGRIKSLNCMSPADGAQRNSGSWRASQYSSPGWVCARVCV